MLPHPFCTTSAPLNLEHTLKTKGFYFPFSSSDRALYSLILIILLLARWGGCQLIVRKRERETWFVTGQQVCFSIQRKNLLVINFSQIFPCICHHGESDRSVVVHGLFTISDNSYRVIRRTDRIHIKGFCHFVNAKRFSWRVK